MLPEGTERRPRLCVVDDDDGIREVLEMAFTDEGYEVATAEDGAAALDIVGRWSPDLIILDLRMPRMDGWAFCRAYHERPPPHAPVLVLTAARDAAAAAAEIAADAALDKPFDLDELSRMVKRLLESRPARSGGDRG